MSKNETVIETRGLTKIYRLGRTEVRALDGVDLTIHQGEFVSVVGRSGSGKTTLLNMIGGLDRPTSGQVLLAGEDLAKASRGRLPKMRREKIGFVFQEYNLIPTLTAAENVELPLKYAGVPRLERRQRARAALEEVELGDRLRHRPTELSGGEQQRVAIARALANRPAVVLADEPTGELDSHTAAQVIEMLRELNERLGLTFVIVTHDTAVAEQTRRIIRFQDGRVVSDEPREAGTSVGDSHDSLDR